MHFTRKTFTIPVDNPLWINLQFNLAVVEKVTQYSVIGFDSGGDSLQQAYIASWYCLD